MLKVMLSASVFAALLVPATVGFEKDGVRVGDALVQGPAVELKSVGNDVFLASGNIIEPLSAELAVEVDKGRTLVLEPGVRAVRAKDGLTLSTHGGKLMKVTADGKTLKLRASESVKVTQKGWQIGEQVLAAGSIRIGLQANDGGNQQGQDPDSDLEAMRRAAARIQAGQGTEADFALLRRVFATDPSVLSLATNDWILKQLTQVTPSF